MWLCSAGNSCRGSGENGMLICFVFILTTFMSSMYSVCWSGRPLPCAPKADIALVIMVTLCFLDIRLYTSYRTFSVPPRYGIKYGLSTQQKGQAYLIRAVAELIKEGNDVRLLIIGKGPMYNWLYKYASRLKIADRFEIISGIPEEEIPYYYNASDLFVLPSLYEPAGMALIEAMACGVPSIATRVGGMPEMGQDTVSYSKPRDYASIKEAIMNCLTDSKNARDRASRAISLVKKRNDWDIIAKEYEDCFLKASSQ